MGNGIMSPESFASACQWEMVLCPLNPCVPLILAESFENRSSDGVVKFDSLESSRIHAANKGLYKVISFVGFVVGILGVIILATGLGL
jgi:hypothetical protein